MNEIILTDVKKIFDMIEDYNTDKHNEDNELKFDKICDNIKHILDSYSNDFETLDPYLKDLTKLLANKILISYQNIELINELFAILHILFQYRGFKVLQTYLPTDVTTFQIIIDLLESSDFSNLDDIGCWKSRYCLLAWSSIAVMIPISLHKFDNRIDLSTPKLMNRIYGICLKYLECVDSCDEIATYLSAKFFTRKDTQEVYLKEFISILLKNLECNEKPHMQMISLMQLSSLLKYLQRDCLLLYVEDILSIYLKCNFEKTEPKRLLKYACKVIRRLGLVFLKPISYGYRYKRKDVHYLGNKCEEVSLKPNFDNNEIYVPKQIEDIINKLIIFLSIKDEEIRCSAAKGISVIFERLPTLFLDEIMKLLLNFFNESLGSPLWHGGCVTLAFLSLNGLLSPKHLDTILPIIQKALFFELKMSIGLMGSLVRDSACFVCWSFARAFDAADVKSFMEKIGTYLILVALFDHQVNCRRAAAAAFQENFGRLGIFPNGFDILPLLQFDLVSNKNITYLNFGPFICQFEHYRYEIIRHIVTMKSFHWDYQIRKLASSSMFWLTFHLKKDEIFNEVFQHLFVMIKNGRDINKIHGALLTLSNSLLSYSIICNYDISNNQELIDELKNVLNLINKNKRIANNSLIKESFCLFIQNMCYSKFPFSNHESIIFEWIDFIKGSFTENAIEIAATALSAVINEYFNQDLHKNIRKDLLDHFINLLKSNNEEIKTSSLVALQNLPFFMIVEFMDVIMENILNEMKINEKTFQNVHSRKSAIAALLTIYLTAIEYKVFDNIDFISGYRSLLSCVKDYTKTTCGDVGRIVREEAVGALEKLTISLANNYPSFFENRHKLLTSILGNLAQQAVDKIDCIRTKASNAFRNIVYCGSPIEQISNLDQIKKFINKDDNFESHDVIFSRFAQMCLLTEYNSNIFLGFISSITSFAETTKLLASEKLVDLIKDQNLETQLNVFKNIIQTFEKNKNKKRIISVLPEFFNLMFRRGHFNQIIENDLNNIPDEIFVLLINEFQKKAIANFPQSLELLGVLIHANSISHRVLRQLLAFLNCDDQYSRKKAIGILYESFLLYGPDLISNQDQLNSIIERITTFDMDNDDLQEFQSLKNQLETILH